MKRKCPTKNCTGTLIFETVETLDDKTMAKRFETRAKCSKCDFKR